MTTRSQFSACRSASARSYGDDDALAGGEAVVLHDVGRAEGVERGGDLFGVAQTCAAAVGTPAARMTSLANALDASISAAARSGPKHRIPAAAYGVGHAARPAAAQGR